MHASLKFLSVLTIGLSMTQANAELVQSSYLNNDAENSSLASRVISKDTSSFNSHFSNLNSLAITERSGDKIRRETIAAKIQVPK